MTISFFRFDTPVARIWAFIQMGWARIALSRARAIGFWKLCGSGVGEGFTPVPNTNVYAVLCTWPDEETARDHIKRMPVFCRYRRWAAETWTIYLAPLSTRGAWSGKSPFSPSDSPDDAPTDAPLAAITRASIRARSMFTFWGREPDISKAIGANPDVMFKIGLGEAPLLRQMTFSVWPDVATMAAFARGTSGPHAQAIKAVRKGNWFTEELYARFQVLDAEGIWNGAPPLNGWSKRTGTPALNPTDKTPTRKLAA